MKLVDPTFVTRLLLLRKPLTLLALAGLLLGVSACSGVPLTSYGKLWRIDPMKADPGDIRVAVQVSDAIDLEPARVNIGLSYRAADGSLDESHELEVTPSGPDGFSPLLEKEAGTNEQLAYFRLGEANAAIMRDFQQQVRAHKSAGGDGEGTISVGINRFCAASALDGSAVPFTVFLRTSPADDYFPLVRGDLNEMFERYGEQTSSIPVCG